MSTQNLYNGMTSCVKSNGFYSDWFPVLQGTSQGGVLSPFLYLVFINDLLEELSSSGLGLGFGGVSLSCPTS